MLAVTYVNLCDQLLSALLLTCTSLPAARHYSNEAYDYPPNIKETFQDLGAHCQREGDAGCCRRPRRRPRRRLR